MLNSGDYYVKQYALDALRRFDAILPSCVSELKDFFAAEKDAALKCAVLKLFTQKKIAGHFEFFAGNISNCEYIVKNAFLDYIGETGETAAKDYLVKLFYAETDPKVRSKAVKTAALLKRFQSGFQLEKETVFDFLNDADARVRANACAVETDFNDVIARAEFKKLLSDASPRVNADAAVLLYKSGDNDILNYVTEKLEGSASPAGRSSMIYAIGRMSGADNYPIIKKYLSDPDHNVRRNAILSAGALKAKEAVTDLLNLYFCEMKQCRENLSVIIGALRSIDEFDSTMAALDMLNASGDDEFRRATLVKIFAHFATADMAHYLVTYLDDTDDRVRANAIEAVCFLKERGAINSDFVVKNILVSMCDPNSRVVANAVRSLYLCGVVSVISVLREMLLSNVDAVRNAARHAVTYFPDGLFVLNS